MAEAPTKQKASQLADQQTSLLSFFLLSPFSLTTSLAEDRKCKALKSTLPQKEYPDTGKVGKREGQKYMGGPHPLTHPPHIHNQRCTEAPKAHTPGLGSFPLNLQAPKNSSLPALPGSMKHQMPSPRTQVGVESKESSSPAPATTHPTGRESQFCLQGPIKDLRAHTLVQRTQGRCLLHLGEESGT